MKKIILSIAIFFLINTQSFGHVEHYSKYNYLEYELFRNNKSIGYHKYTFDRNGSKLIINNEVNFKKSFKLLEEIMPYEKSNSLLWRNIAISSG